MTIKLKWMLRLEQEVQHRSKFEFLDEYEWRTLLKRRVVCSTNHDTGLCLDFPHYCSEATEACGGNEGWCYTFQGRQANAAHHEKVMLVDQLATNFPQLFGEVVALEVFDGVARGVLCSPNIRLSGSGELHERHVPAILALLDKGVHVWGFTKRKKVWQSLKSHGVELLFSIDSTTDLATVNQLLREKAKFAYTSAGVHDKPMVDVFVTFPLHRGGKVREVVQSASLCPKVLEDFFENQRRPNWCQSRCNRCHLKS